MPRELRLLLGFVTWSKQAQRCGEIARRMGRLPGRAEVTLPPRFSEIEEGDWVQWQSDRHFGGATLTFRVDGWGSNEKWHHTLTLRQISASVYSDTAPLDDGSIAAQHPAPPAIGAPNGASWALAAGHKRTDDAFAYAVTGFGGLAGKVTVNSTNGSVGKGDVTLANTITGEGYFELSVSRSGVPVGTYTTQVVTVDDLPPINNAGAGGTDTTLTAITSTAYATMTSQDSGDPVLDVVVAGVGDTLKLVANFKYQHIPATATGSPASMTCKAECSPDNWATVIAMDGGGADATGSPSQAGTPEDRVKGELIHTFTKTGLAAGTYKVRLQGKKTAAASGTLQVQSGSATSSKA